MNMKILGSILGIIVLLLIAWWGFSYFGDDITFTYDTYTNERYGYQVEYPMAFTAEGESANGDGQTFTGENVSLRVFGMQNVQSDSLRAVAQNYIEESVAPITVEEVPSQSIVLRGTSGDTIETVKVIRLNTDTDAYGVAVLQYQAGALDAGAADSIMESFQVGTLRDDNDNESADNEDDGSGMSTSTTPIEGYTTYQSSDLAFSIAVPEGASVSEQVNDRVQFTFLGPDNEPNTEIADGFTVTIHRDDVSRTFDSTFAYAQSVVEERRSSAENEITSGLEQRLVNGLTAYRFYYRGALGNEIGQYIFYPEEGTGFQVSYSVADPHNRGYERIVFTMLENLTFYGMGDDVSGNIPTYSTVDLAMLDYAAVGDSYTKESSGPSRGCDRVVMVPRTIPPTTAPLTAALEALFSINTDSYGGWQNFMATANDTLSFERARVSNGVASIYLTGSLPPLGGVCDNPRTAIQLEETALQFATVDSVQFYLNGVATDLRPRGSGL